MAKLNHVGIYISDLEKSKQFYDEIFDFKVVHEFTSGEAKIAMLDIGGSALELVQRPGSPCNPPEGNWSHLAIYDPNLDQTIEKLNTKSIKTRIVTMANGNRLCFFADPDGHVIEIMEKGF